VRILYLYDRISEISMFEKIKEFEYQISKFTGAPFVVTTDCCTHAIELCMILDNVKECSFSAFTYLSILQTMHKLKIAYKLLDEKWTGEYHFHNTRIWDSARRLEPNMYRKGQLQCLSFGYTKPVDIGRGGAILLDSKEDYDTLRKMRYDGRDLDISPWIEQIEFNIGYHYKLNPEECIKGIKYLDQYIKAGRFDPLNVSYPDCRRVKIK
jgi:dTDP-4-amino-4,6-dideoxygalactose transaminase